MTKSETRDSPLNEYDRTRRQRKENLETPHQRHWHGRSDRNKHERRESERPMGFDGENYSSGYGQPDDGRLGGGYDDEERSGIKFKGRGSMKYRERNW